MSNPNLFIGSKEFASGLWQSPNTDKLLIYPAGTRTESPYTYESFSVAEVKFRTGSISQVIYVNRGKSYTLSAFIYLPHYDTRILFKTGAISAEIIDTNMASIPTEEWTRVFVSFIANNDGPILPQFVLRNNDAFICGLKFEEGEEMTDWCESEEEKNIKAAIAKRHTPGMSIDENFELVEMSTDEKLAAGGGGGGLTPEEREEINTLMDKIDDLPDEEVPSSKIQGLFSNS